MSTSRSAEKTIVIRDRRKPNQYTTDNLIAREWLPILRIGDAFFFYSVYLSMANRETESSWGSLRTLSQYLQCGVDLIVRGNKLLEICELIHIEPGNQYTSNEYYILDPPSLTPELVQRISQRLDDITAEELGKNWQSWIRQVRKALSRHRSLTSIWAERRANKGGRPVKTVRPKKGDRESHAGFSEKGACDSQPGYMCPTTTAHVTHDQGVRESHAEQDKQTRTHEQDKERSTSPDLLLVRTRCQALEVAPGALDVLLETYPLEQIVQQLEWLPFRQPRDPAGMLIRAVQGNWTRPSQYDPEQAQQIWARWMAPHEEDGEPAGKPPPAEALQIPGTDLDAGEVWKRVLEELRMQMTRATFDTWLGGSRIVNVWPGGITVRVRDGYAVEWLRARWHKPIQRTVTGIAGRSLDVRFEV